MRKLLVLAALLLLCLALLSGSAFARDWFVSNSGNDNNNGTIGSPLATVQTAWNNSQAGNVIQLRAGTYGTINGGYGLGKNGTPSAWITVRSYDGDLTAQIGNAFLQPCSYISFEGINFYNNDMQCVNVCGLETSYRVYTKSHHINFKRCKFINSDTNGTREAGSEIFKSSQSEYLLVEDCELGTTTTQNPTDASVGMDFVWVSYSTARRLYMHDYYHVGVYWKGGSQYDTLEDSVVVNGRTPSYNSAVFIGGDGTGIEFANPATIYETEYEVVRNNILNHTSNGGITITSANWAWIYNNLIADVGDAQALYQCYRPYINHHDYCNTGSQHIRVYNNISLDTAGDMGSAYGNDIGTITDWASGNNCFWNNGNPVPAGNLTVDGVAIDPATEAGSMVTNPYLTLSGTPTTWQGWVDYYRPTSNSTAIRDAGNSNAGACPRPGVLADIEGVARPRGSGWDIGPYEWPGTVNAPTADFGADSTWGTSPATINFADYSTAGPTNWSWTFGDSCTSTAQNPSHTYANYGNYTVSLTAANTAGSNTNTKTNYISVKALNADFTSDKTWGPAPLTVSFTDATSNSPTSWSWAFGDGGASTAQNPSHTYSNTGYYSVSLTAANANGSDTGTKSNYIAACTDVIVYPTAYFMPTPAGGNQHLVSGSLANLQVADGTCMQFASDTTDTTSYVCRVYFTAASGYTASQLMGGIADCVTRCDQASDTCGKDSWVPGCASVCSIRPWPSTLTNLTYASLTPLDVDGNLYLNLCVKPATTKRPINVFVDQVRWHLCLKPSQGSAPVANFSGTPTSGSAPLAVSFTDSSTNTPTAWSWTFGDGNSSTAQNPSHTYSAGTYTVALTATNAYGNNTNTKSNYISVTVAAPVASFTSTPPTSGVASFSVSFTDTSTNSPTSWSWTFGDSGSSTAQNPSHTYTAAGTYDVAMTATNSGGSNTCTYPGWVTVRNSAGSVSLYPASYSAGNGTVLSGALSDTNSENGTYFVTQCNTSTHGYSWGFTFEAGYAPSALSALHVEMKQHCSRSDTPSMTYYISRPGQSFDHLSWPALRPTSDQWVTYDTTDVASCMDASNNVQLMICGCPTSGNSNNYTLSYDVVRLILTVAPPVANFSGAPTSGNAPLSVSFTDSTTNNPTAWSWTFGDGGTTTAQNPSHTYSSAGAYTVALTATNGGGNNTNTKTNYITVASANPPVASFTSTPPTAGVTSLSVSFTDTSTNSPTSWSWTFGDGNSSTAHNPSHTYTAAGTYDVALTATNSAGNNTCTYPGWVTVRSSAGSVVQYPAGYAIGSGTVTSGSLTDTNSENGTYFAIQCDTSSHGISSSFTWNTGYPPSQLSALRVEMKQHCSRSDTPSMTFYMYRPGQSYDHLSWPALRPTSDQWVTYDTTDVASCMDASNHVQVMICGCPSSGNSNNYTESYDVVRLILTLK